MITPEMDVPAAAASAPMALGEEVTIATAAYGNVETTRSCLKCLFQSASGPYELILIDDCSPDSGAIRSLYAEARKHHANTKIFSFSENLEYSGSLNAILSHATGDWVFFLSNDIFINPSYLRLLLEASRANPALGLLRGSSNYVDNGKPSHNLKIEKPVRKLRDVLDIGADVAAMFGNATQADPFLIGDAFVATRALIAKIGALDPWFYGYFADIDYGLRAQVAGFELALVRGAFAYHQRDANFGYLPEKERKAKLQRRWMRVYENWARFKLKWRLPVAMAYPDIGELPWGELAAMPFDIARHFSAPVDYSRHLI
jgi:GT2 family glycosyltransferase